VVETRVAPVPAVAARQRFACFDGYRGIAAGAIVVFHVAFFTGFGLHHRLAGDFLARLDVGVALFFVISGFLLYRPFVVAHLAGSDAPPAGSFWRRRLLRIVPAYWVTLAVVVYVLGLKHIAGVGDAIVYFGFLQIYDNRHLPGGISQAWSLCTEMSFYLVLPLYAWAVRRRGRAMRGGRAGRAGRAGREVRAVVLVYCTGLLVRGLIAFGWLGRPSAVYDCRLDWLPATMDLFALGMALAVASAWHEQGGRLPAWLAWLGERPWACWTGAAAAYVIVSTVVFDAGDLGRAFTPGQVVGREVFYGLVAALLIIPGVFGREDEGGIRRLLRSRPLALAGIGSYGIYLTHEAVIDAYASHAHLLLLHAPAGRLLVVTVLGSALAAAVLHQLVERPALALKARTVAVPAWHDAPDAVRGHGRGWRRPVGVRVGRRGSAHPAGAAPRGRVPPGVG